MEKIDQKKIGIEKFTVSKIRNQRMVFGGDDGTSTLRPTGSKTKPTQVPK